MIIVKKRHLIALALVGVCMCSLAQADEHIEMTANIVKNTCQLTLDNNGFIGLDTQQISEFDNSVTPNDLYRNGKSFSVHLLDCDVSTGVTPQSLVIRFRPRSGAFSPYSNQIFPNESIDGARNVGIVILSIEDINHPANVLNTDGSPKSIFTWQPITNNTSYPFYARMQKENSAQQITPGQVNTTILVEAYYE